MTFDINQTAFPSEKHKTIWRHGVLVLPEELSLSGKVRSLMDADLSEGCRQMRSFILHILGDMYENASSYAFEPWQIFSFWLNIIGDAPDPENYERIDVTASVKGKTTAANIKGLYADVLAHTGVTFTEKGGKTEIANALYPKMFRAMKAMQKYVREKKERASLENSFQICDFRKICPGYKYEKTEKRLYMREIEDRIPLILEGEKIPAALAFSAYLRTKKIHLKWTGIQNSWSETGQVHMNQGLCYVGLGDVYLKGRKNGWVVCVPLSNLDKYRDKITNGGWQNFIWDNIYICDKTPANACNGGEKSIYACHRGIDLDVLGKTVHMACRLRNRRRAAVYVHDPDETSIGYIKSLIELEQKANDK